MPRQQKPFQQYCRPFAGHLLWRGAINSDGYGSYRQGGKVRKAHHVAYELMHGPIPADKVVMHTCDIRICMEHLALGTQGDNVRDAIKKGRVPHISGGDRPNRQRFDRDRAMDLRASDASYASIAGWLGVDTSSVHAALSAGG